MPKERIRKSGRDGFADLLVQWGPDEIGTDHDSPRVRLFIAPTEFQRGSFAFTPELTDEEKRDNPDRIGGHGESIGPVDIYLDREQLNRAIRVLRRARDAAYGRDE